ncbi:MAG: PadR family transcriptional regulator [Anaerolineales bacterium]
MVEDENAANRKFQKEITSGIASLILLKVLAEAPEPMYGYQISKVLGLNDDQAPLMKQGALYPVLRSLEKNGLLSSQVEPSVSGPPRRYYTITTQGKDTLQEWVGTWNEVRTYVDNLLEGKVNYD